MITYKIPIYCRLEQVMPSVRRLVNNLNTTMLEEFGFQEKISIRSPVFTMTITLKNKPDKKTISQIQQAVQKSFKEKVNLTISVADFLEWKVQ